MGVTETETRETIRSLVESTHQSKMYLRWLTVVVVFCILLAVSLGILAAVSYNTNEQIKTESHAACLQSKRNSEVINNFLHQLIANAKITKTLTEKEKRARIQGYQKLLITLPKCKEGD